MAAGGCPGSQLRKLNCSYQELQEGDTPTVSPARGVNAGTYVFTWFLVFHTGSPKAEVANYTLHLACRPVVFKNPKVITNIHFMFIYFNFLVFEFI